MARPLKIQKDELQAALDTLVDDLNERNPQFKTITRDYAQRYLGKASEVPPCVRGRKLKAAMSLIIEDGNGQPICFVYKGTKGWKSHIPPREERVSKSNGSGAIVAEEVERKLTPQAKAYLERLIERTVERKLKSSQ